MATGSVHGTVIRRKSFSFIVFHRIQVVQQPVLSSVFNDATFSIVELQ